MRGNQLHLRVGHGPRAPLRSGALVCLGLWALIWLMYMAMRFSPFDIHAIPGVGFLLLGSLAVAFLAPVAASAFAAVALLKQPRAPFSWLVLGAAVAVLVGQPMLFMASQML
jgi:hypothetical protein